MTTEIDERLTVRIARQGEALAKPSQRIRRIAHLRFSERRLRAHAAGPVSEYGSGPLGTASLVSASTRRSST
jgi:hypothetical protein